MGRATEFKDRLQRLIDLKKINQVDLAKGIGVQESRISDWLKGKPKKPHRKSIVKISDFFECDPDWLQQGIGDPYPTRPGQNIQITGSGNVSQLNSSFSVHGHEAGRPQVYSTADPELGELLTLLEEFETRAGIKQMLKKYRTIKEDYGE